MEKSKTTEQYTFGADEKETLQKISIVEASVGQNIQEKIKGNYFQQDIILNL